MNSREKIGLLVLLITVVGTQLLVAWLIAASIITMAQGIIIALLISLASLIISFKIAEFEVCGISIFMWCIILVAEMLIIPGLVYAFQAILIL